MHIVVVDDDPDFLHLAARALEVRGHTVECIGSAFGLVNRVAGANSARTPDVVMLDCDLPGLSGLSAIEILARDRRTANVPVLLVSAQGGPAQLEAARQHGRAVFVQKDGRMKALVDALESHAAVELASVQIRR